MKHFHCLIRCVLLLFLTRGPTLSSCSKNNLRLFKHATATTTSSSSHIVSPLRPARSQWSATKMPRGDEPSEGDTETTKGAIAVTIDKQNDYHIVKAKGDGSSFSSDPTCVAWGAYTDSIGSAGWGALEIHTVAGFPDEKQMYAAGLIEGALTHKRIRQLYMNDVALRSAKSLRGLYEYFEEQDAYLRSHSSGGEGPSAKSQSTGEGVDEDAAYWQQVVLIMSQLDGLLDGYNHAISTKTHRLVLGDMWLLNMDGDIIDLERAIDLGAIDNLVREEEPADSFGDLMGASVVNSLLLQKQEQAGADVRRRQSLRPSSMNTENKGNNQANTGRYSKQRWDKLMRHARCSALIKVLPDFSDILVGHATWADYSELLRIWKTYDFPLAHVQSKIMSFSSYAGMLSSTDDWYITDRQLLVTETTTQVEDESTFRELDPRTQVDSWVRTMVANRLATDGATWSRLYVKGNSGTYNCQWMVLDFKKFTFGTQPQDGFYTMTEIIPGSFRAEDMTAALLSRGNDKCDMDSEDSDACVKNTMYWPSVNRPFWPDIRARAGYPEEDPEAADNAFFSFENNPRGRVFARDQSHVKSIQDMMAIITYNDPSDPLQEDAGHGIASRFDLPGADANDPTIRPTGAIDFKVSSARMVAKMMSVSQIGPTHEASLPHWRQQSLEGGGQGDRGAVSKPFRWDDSESFSTVPHFGVPMELDFDWQIMGPGKLDLPQKKASVQLFVKNVEKAGA